MLLKYCRCSSLKFFSTNVVTMATLIMRRHPQGRVLILRGFLACRVEAVDTRNAPTPWRHHLRLSTRGLRQVLRGLLNHDFYCSRDVGGPWKSPSVPIWMSLPTSRICFSCFRFLASAFSHSLVSWWSVIHRPGFEYRESLETSVVENVRSFNIFIPSFLLMAMAGTWLCLSPISS